jgi:serine/threonine protein kinase/class 3 adenylate cyclase
MNLGPYQLLAQLGAGRDGIAYRAQLAEVGTPVEVQVLTAARADANRWDRLRKRLRMVAMLNQPSSLRIHELGLDHDPPYVALEWSETNNLVDELSSRAPLSLAEGMALALELAETLAAAHRLGLVHGRLTPHGLGLTRQGVPRIDFTGLETGEALSTRPTPELEALCHPPATAAEASTDPATDVYAVGALLIWLLSGVPSVAGLDQLGNQIGTRAAEAGAATCRLLREMCAGDPMDRPLMPEVSERLRTLATMAAPTQAITPVGSLEATSDQGWAESDLGHAPPILDEASSHERQGRSRLRRQLAQGSEALADQLAARDRLGRFRLLEKLGQGGMGAVYKAEDLTDGTVVAIKLLRADWARRPEALRRFHKEARLLAEVNNPYVANLLEVNEDDGIHYLAIEYVAGQSLARVLTERGRLDEPTALAIMADVCRALEEPHNRGIVHRDIKPDNILMVRGGAVQGEEDCSQHHVPRVKLSDFGLARHIVETESLNVTQAGTILGTPLYMAPEQGIARGPVDARADVYALGATLFHLLAGRPPFMAATPLAVIALHCNEPPPALKKLDSALSDGVCQIVNKALAKHPDSRYADAGELLRDLERLLRGEPTSMVVHPKLPPCDPEKLLQYDWTWELESAPAALWPHVSNTERLNRAVGLPAVKFTTDPLVRGRVVSGEGVRGGATENSVHPAPRVRRFGQFRKAGLSVAYEEHPFEWIEARRFGVLREYTQGPFKWLVSLVELEPRAGGGTTLTHRVRIEPHGLLGRTVAAVEVGIRGRRAVEQVYRRIDAYLAGALGNRALTDPFEEPVELPAARRRRLERLADQLIGRGVNPSVVESMSDFLAHAPAQEVARIRPLALAHRLGLDEQEVVAACLHAAREGLLVLLWDILCPVCRIPSDVRDTLRALREHGRCEACNLDFELDFANSVELIFRAHPDLRETEARTYCVGGPAHSPHVVAQVRLDPQERIELDLNLTEGVYRLGGPQLPFHAEFRVQPAAATGRWEAALSQGPAAGASRRLKTGRQVLVLTNDYAQELVVRVERTASRGDALTAARASSLALFRELFPDEILSPGQLVSVANVTLLATRLDEARLLYDELGDVRAFAVIHEHFRLLGECIRREGGAVVKTLGEGALAVFHETAAAVRAALDLQPLLARESATRNLRLRIGVHRGPAMAATVNDHLDYFGATVHHALQLLECTGGGELVLTQAVAADSQVAALIRSRGLEAVVLQPGQPGLPGGVVHRLVPIVPARYPEVRSLSS